ncbi:hypothetical protein [Nocardia jejuensis]|uniref:hypothetical protein n=1 Tax=Nocardia jejuensis TaxID=328049 RepID=UPI000A6A0BC1|nr:hypothetical protein [Nocardia jejuensis]
MRPLLTGAGVLSAALALAAGAAHAESIPISLSLSSAGPDQYGCVFTGLSCSISVGNVTDYTTPIAISVNGAPLGTVLPTGQCCDSYNLVWTPQKAGKYTVTAKQGTQTDEKTVQIVDENSLQGIIKRYIGS